VRLDDSRSFVVADVPGLIEGSHEGAGLGHRFLRHVERTSVILHLVGLAEGDDDPVNAYRTVRRELERYADSLAHRETVVALSKADLVENEGREEILERFQKDTGIRPMLVSAATGEGITPLVGALAVKIDKLKEKEDDRQ
jgi:GTP-binding protein